MLCVNTLGVACFSSRRLVTLSALRYGQKKDLNLGRSLEFGHYGQEKGPNSGRQLGLERPVRKTAEGDEATALKSWMAELVARGRCYHREVIARLDRATILCVIANPCKRNGRFLCEDFMKRPKECYLCVD